MLELELAVEMVLDHALVAAGDEDEMLDAGLARLVDHVLDQRPVDHRQHLLRHGLGGGQEPGAQPGDRENGFADRFHVGMSADCDCLGIAEVWVCHGYAASTYSCLIDRGQYSALAQACQARQPFNGPATFRFPIVGERNNRSETKHHGEICPTDAPVRGAVLATAVLAAPVLGQSLDIRAPSPCAARDHRRRSGRAARRGSDAGAGMERRIRRVQSSADDGAGDPRGRG